MLWISADDSIGLQRLKRLAASLYDEFEPVRRSQGTINVASPDGGPTPAGFIARTRT